MPHNRLQQWYVASTVWNTKMRFMGTMGGVYTALFWPYCIYGFYCHLTSCIRHMRLKNFRQEEEVGTSIHYTVEKRFPSTISVVSTLFFVPVCGSLVLSFMLLSKEFYCIFCGRLGGYENGYILQFSHLHLQLLCIRNSGTTAKYGLHWHGNRSS